MTTSTSFAQMANNQSISLSSALRANTPPTKGQTPSHKFLTLSIFFLLSFFTTNLWGEEATISSFTSASGKFGDVSYNAYKGGGTSNPAVKNDNAIRLYQNASGNTGGYIVLSVPDGYTITSATIKSTMGTTTGYYIDSNPGATTPAKADFEVSNKSLSANTEYTVSGLSTQYITFACFGKTSSTRLYISYLSVTYQSAAAKTYNVTLSRNGVTETINDIEEGTALDYIDGTGDQGGCSPEWVFEGWSKTQRSAQNNTAVMDLVTTVDGAGPYYAVYSHTEGSGGSTTATMSSFTAVSGNVNNDANVSYEAAKGTAGTAPAVNSSEIRIYQNGGTLTITGNNGKKLTSITIGSSMATSVSYKIDGGTESSNQSIAANGKFTLNNIEASSVLFTCKGTDKNSRLYLNYLSVTYSGGSTVYYTTSPECTTQTVNCSLLKFITDITENYTAIYTQNETATDLTVSAQYNSTSTGVTYQWYSNTTESNTGGTLISGATNASYTPVTTTEGTKYYYCVATYDECTIASNVATVTITAPVPTFMVTFNSDGGSAVATQTIEEGKTATTPSAPTKAGHTFIGWYNGDTEFDFSTPITDDITLKAKWQICSYTLTWDLNGGTVTTAGTHAAEGATGSLSGDVEYGASITAPIVEREGYRFDGWKKGNAIVTPATTMPANNLTYTAQWKATYTVTFLNHGEEVEKVTVEAGNPVPLPTEELTSCDTENYPDFFGWTETPIAGVGTTAPADLITAGFTPERSMNLHAVFVDQLPQEGGWQVVTSTSELVAGKIYTIGSYGSPTTGTAMGTQNTNNRGTTSWTTGTPVELTLGGSTGAWTLYDPVEEGYLYAASSSKNYLKTQSSLTNDGKWAIKFDNKKANIVAQGNNTRNIIRYNSSSSIFSCYESGQGDIQLLTKAIGTQPTAYITSCCETPAPTNGTYTCVSGTEVQLQWNGSASRYHITCANPIIDDHTESTSYEVSSLTECEEYTFYVSAHPKDGCESAAITITAQPFMGAKTVTFNPNGGAVSPTSFTTSCDKKSTTLPTPTYSGYRFLGWFTEESGGTEINENPYSPNADITLHAHWAKEYSVTYDANGGSTTCAGGAYIAGETVTVCTTSPSKTGHTFTGWTYSPEVTITDGKFTMPASNITITAQWTINQYNVTWKPNGGNWVGSTENIVHTYDYGATINRPTDPTRDGYRFIGWDTTVASTMPTTNITYTAQWKQNYTITFHDGDDTTPWTQTAAAESIDLNTYVGTHACGEYNFAGWSTGSTQYNDQTANITTWVTGTYTPTANIHLYAVYVKGDLATDFTLNCDGGVYEIWEKGHNQHMAGRQNGSGNQFYTTEYWDANNSESNGTPFTITKVADNTYTLQNADGQYITRDSYDGNADELEIKDTWENADRYKWIISNGTNGTWRFTNKAATSYALVYYNNKYFELRSASSVTAGNTTTYDLELTPAQTNVYQSNPNCGPYTITFETGGGEFIQGNYKYSTQKTSNLTEPTISQFPAAELDGYTFAGWKDGSPQEDINYEPYLKKADDNLVVSSNKTYYAVYYYYDEEEDIDWSKEFTTAIYADVNGIKYFLAGAPNGGTMSSTTDCGYVSEVTITPGTGANAGKYKITVNGIAMAPEANETDLLNGTYWWTITERSVGSGEYKISGQDKKNIVLRNSSWGHYTYNQGSEYGNGYYYPHFGKCLQHHWTSNPSPKPSITISGDVYVTATNGRGIMATQSLSVAANNLYAGESLTLSSESSDIYFSAERNVNFVKADKPTASLTLTADATGKLEDEVYIHYKPSTDGDGVSFDVIVTAKPTASSVSKDHTIHVRNLPAKFVIATKVGATWYALPADMSSATNPLGVVIEVDETTMTTIAPNTTTYTLWPVKTTATENDRYTNVTGAAYGDRVRFAAVNYEQRGLWANNNNNGSTIRNYAVINSLGDDVLAGYEWKITTTVVDGHWQYTLQTDQDKNQNFLRYWTSAEGTPVGPKWGTYNAGENKLYFLPVTETQPFEYAVVEWYPTKVLIQTDAAITSPTVKVDGKAVASPILTNKGGKLYEISNLPLETNPNKLLQISFTDNAINYTNTKVVPIILSRGAKTITGEPFATLTQKVYQYADVVVRDGATLTIDGTTDVANTLLGVTIYPTAKVSVAEGKKLSVHTLTFFGGIDEIYDGSAYTINKYGVPQLSLKGTLGKTVTTMDYIMRVDLDQMYQVGVPYNVDLSDVTYWDGSAIKLGDELYVSAYDGQARANLDLKNTWIWEVNFAEKVLKAGIGYTISAEPQVAGDTYSILRMPMKDNIASGNTEESKQVPVIAYANQHSVQIADNHKGWNYLSNPYMTAISGGEADTKLVLGYLKETGTGPWEWMNDEIRYVTIPHDDGEDYDQKKFSEAELKPFKSFFVQIAQGGELSFALASRQNAPARYMEVQTEQEVEFEILLSNDKQSDNTGLLIAEQYSPAYEINADLEKMIGSMSVYTIYGGYNLAYNAISPVNASEWIPMGYIAPAAGEYTFRLDDIDKIVEQVEHVYLIDYEANNIVDLMDDEYEFTTDKEQNNNRFAINVVLSQDKDNTTTGLDIIQGNNAAPIKFIYHDKMYIQSGGVIYDATGKQVTNINK